MKLSLNRILFASTATALVAAGVAAVHVHADTAPWRQSVVSGSAIEAALYRAMDLPGLRMLYPRPPAEARNKLNALVTAHQSDAQLYALRARVDEQSLDFAAAEADWKSFAARAQDKTAAQFALADFYHRRNDGEKEIAALEAAAAVPSPTEKFIAANNQQAWQAFSRALTIAHDQAYGDDAAIAIYKAWIVRYPGEPAVRGNFIAALLKMRRYDEVQRAIDEYKTAFPQDQVFPIKADALLAFDQGSTDATNRALAQFDKSYQPLWPSDLVSTYFALLDATHTKHAMLISTRAQLSQNPDDLAAATKLFHYYQQQGRTDAAINVLAEYGSSKDVRHVSWSGDELYTFATLLDRALQYQEAARYYFALASNTGRLTVVSEPAEEAGLTGLIHILLTAPGQPIALGAGNLSLYRDLATVDDGPGYLNGILSLWLNSQDPAAEFNAEEQKATPYFHREKAAELLAILDQHFSASPARAALHAQLIQAYAGYGQDNAVKQAGQHFLADFPNAPQRIEVAFEVADADARTNDTQSEFALYDNLLVELARSLHGMPLTASSPSKAAANVTVSALPVTDEDNGAPVSRPPSGILLQQALAIPVGAPTTTATGTAYRQVLDRYISRLIATKQPLAALALLRRELDRNPNDPLLYERLADFLQQNDLSAQEEEVYRRAITRFNDTTFYDKLARFYLHQKRNQDFDNLTHKVVDIFQGTELEQYFSNVTAVWPQEYLELNLYAHRRFPHDLVFTRNLLSAYQNPKTLDSAAWERLLREHWPEAPDLQSEFFEYLSRTHQLSNELASLKALVPSSTQQQQNVAATRELADIQLWQSHFEQSAPLFGELAQAYPADVSIGEDAASVFRSLAYFDPKQVARAVEIRQHLSDANPTDLDRLAAIGDTYADSTAASLNLDTAQQLAEATPFWRRMATVHPGVSYGYLQSATIFWDYFQFDDALGQIAAARKQFQDPVLYGYQAGVLYENKRDYPRAIAEYVAAATAPSATSDSDAHSRIIELASRAQFANLVDQTSANAIAQHPTLASLQLRVDVLSALHQKSSVGPAVEAVIAHASTADALADLAAFSQTHQLTHAYQLALEREISITTDPVQRIELQYQLAHSYQDQNDFAAAQPIIESVYNDNSRLVGVVRATTDFYWNTKQPQRAIATLVQASEKANAGFARDFTLEAIDKSNQSGDYAGARTLLKPLLTSDPFNPQYLNLQAESFSLAHDDSGLRDFYASTIDALQKAPLSPIERRDKIALARQGMIPALTSLKDYSGGIDQHIALISAFPEDSNILQAAIAYARLHSRETQLVAFLNKTVADSPRDSRFAIDLGRVDVQFEDYAGALAAYSKAIAIRSDRPDLYIARADLEEHQQNFDAVCSDYDLIYLLTYKNPQWMEKAALARARQGKPDLAVKALQTAWIEGHTPTAADYFHVAKQLAEWNMLQQADAFAAQGIKLAGNDLLADPANSEGATIYGRLLARERKIPEALALLTRVLQASDASPSSPVVIVQQIEQKGLASVTDSEWRQHLVEARRRQAESTYRSALEQMFSVVAEFYTPEEKAPIAALLDTKRAASTMPEMVELWIPAAKSSGLKDREAAWRHDVLLHGGELAQMQLDPFRNLEDERMDYDTLAETLDAYAQQVKPAERPGVLPMAATAWHNTGNYQREAIDLRKLVVEEDQRLYEERLFENYLHSDPAALLQLTTLNAEVADAAANYLLAHGTQTQAYMAIANRASRRPPVWASATSALTRLYFGDTSLETDAGFEAALANDPIGQRLQGRPDQSNQIVGDPWFYYGTRYGYFLTLLSKPAYDPEDYLPAELELSPTNPDSYNVLARTYLDAHKIDDAIAEYQHVIELEPTNPSPDIAIAEALWPEGRHDDAFAEWNQALAKLRAMVDLHSVPENFWTSFAAIANDATRYQIGVQLKPGMDSALQAYIRKNGNYRSTELLHSAYIALEKQNDSAAIDWVLSLVADVPTDSQLSALSDLLDQDWLPHSQYDGVYRREIYIARAQLQVASTSANHNNEDYALTQLTRIQTEYINWLIENNRAADAQRIFDSIEPRQRQTEELRTVAVVLAAKQSRIPDILASYTSDPTTAPSLTALSQVANTLRLQHDLSDSRLLLEYVFQQKLQQQSLSAPDYLALAEARIATNDMPGALNLFNRLTLQGDLYENLDAASSLLVRTGHTAEALPMLKKLATGTPWREDYLVRLGQAQLALKQSSEAAKTLAVVASSDQASYAQRATAANAMRTVTGTKQFNNSGELTLLAAATLTPQQANQPYFVYARVAMAANAPPSERASTLRAAIQNAPDPMLNWLRLRIFESEIAQTRYEQAQVAIAPLLANRVALRFLYPDNTSSNNFDDQVPQNDTKSTINPISAAYTIGSALATNEDQRAFLLNLASMYEHLGHTQQAIGELQSVARLTNDVTETSRFSLRIKALQRQIDTSRENAIRRPVVHDSIEQSASVKPRLTLATAEVQP